MKAYIKQNDIILDVIKNILYIDEEKIVGNRELVGWKKESFLFCIDDCNAKIGDYISTIQEADKIPMLTINSISIPCETKDQANNFAGTEIKKLNEEKAKTELLKALENNDLVPQAWIDFRTQRDTIKSLVDTFITDNNLV